MGRWIEVGHAFTNDIVLRDASTRGVRFRLRAGEGSAELDLVEGEVSFLGHVASAPSRAILPAYAPLILGDSALAIGEPGSARWADAERLLAVSRGDAPAAAEADGSEALPPWRVLSPMVAALPRFAPVLPIAGGALAAVLVLALIWGGVSRLLSSAPTPSAAQAALVRDGFKTVQVEAGGQGLLVKGLLPHERDLARLKSDVAGRGWPALVAVRTNDTLVRNVADVMRTNGFEGEAKAIGLGVVAVSLKSGADDPARLELLRRRILQDAPGLRQLAIEGEAGGDADLLGSDPNKKVVSVVGGDEGYVQTADGARYFVGAVLPTGHTITAIDGQSVTVQKDGRTTQLAF